MPIQFITGHTHIRAYSLIDSYSSSFEAGRYLDTIGFVSFPVLRNIHEGESPIFFHQFVNGSMASLKHALDSTNIHTPSGQALSQQILEVRESMGLGDVIGCSPRTYELYKPLSQDDSLLSLYLMHIVPSQLFRGESKEKLYIQNSGAFRYNLFKGLVTVDDIISVTPYNDTIYVLNAQVYGSDLLQALSEYLQPKTASPPLFVISSDVELNDLYDIYIPEFDVPFIVTAIQNVTRTNIQALVINQTTTGTLIRDYISSQWKCQHKELPRNILTMSLLSFLLVFTAALLYTKRHRRSQYSELDGDQHQQRGVRRNFQNDTASGGEIL
jgi:2',3'-cyclic-nucleotide 2'-phosphodiesterase (5'-nucleotidase family)